MKRSKAVALCLGVLSVLAVGTASAHGVFFAERVDHPTLVLGEGPTDNGYEPSMVTGLDGYDTMFKPVDVTIVPHEYNITIEKPENLGVTATFFDYGHWTKDAAGKLHHMKMDMVPNAVKSTHAVKYNINYWDEAVTPGYIYNVPIQIVPDVNPLTLRKGDTFGIQVFKDGKPYANAPLIKDVINDLTNESEADAMGRATVTVNANGLNVVGVEVGFKNEEDSRKQVKYFSSLSYTIAPE